MVFEEERGPLTRTKIGSKLFLKDSASFDACPCLTGRHVPIQVSLGTPSNNVTLAAVISSTRNPVYAKQKLFLLMWRRLFSPCLLSLVFFLTLPFSVNADSLEDAAKALARKVATSLQGVSVTCEVRNSSRFRESRKTRRTANNDQHLGAAR